MPNVSTYIRSEDLSRYLAIKEKNGWAEFIHNALNKVTIEDVADVSLSGRVKLYDKVKPTRTYISGGKIVTVAESEVTNIKPIKTPKFNNFHEDAKLHPEIIKQPQDIPPLKRDDPEWEGPILKKGKK